MAYMYLRSISYHSALYTSAPVADSNKIGQLRDHFVCCISEGKLYMKSFLTKSCEASFSRLEATFVLKSNTNFSYCH